MHRRDADAGATSGQQTRHPMDQASNRPEITMRAKLSALALLALVATETGAGAATSFPFAPMRQAGTLTCAVEPGVGIVFGSTRATRCAFVSNRGGFTQSYNGRLDRAGIDLGMTSGQTIAWRVMTPGGASRSSMLDGFFAGPSAEATLFGGPGSQLSFVVGGDRVVLEPVMYSGHAGLSFALGEARMAIGASAPAIVR